MTDIVNASQPGTRATMRQSGSAALRRWLLQPRLEPSFGALEASILALYSAILAITIPFHEPWADEAQAWLIARDSSLWDIFYRRLHYEGTPGLWHLILWFATRLHLPYASLSWISALCAIGGIYVFLRYSPFPALLRALIPFTFWLQYQYAVTGRSYSLVPLCAFGLCALFFRRRPRPVLFAVVAGLMANLSLYAFLWAGALSLVYVPELWKRSSALLRRGRVSVVAGAVLCVLFLFAFYTALPAPDLIARKDGAGLFQRRSAWKDKLLPPTPVPEGWSNLTKEDPWPKLPPDRTIYSRGNGLQRAAIRLLHPEDPSYSRQTLGHRLQRLIVPINGVFYPISASNLLGGALWIVSIVWLVRRHSLRFALPVGLMILLGALTWINDHHTGLLFIGLISALWLSLLKPQERVSERSRLSGVLSVLLLLVALEQVTWSEHAVIGDVRLTYDPGRATADYLKQNEAGKRLMAYGYETVSIVPFLPPHAFLNQPTTYWIWSKNIPYERRLRLDTETRPEVLVVGRSYIRDQHMANQWLPELPYDRLWSEIDVGFLANRGYGEKARFCGNTFMRGGSSIVYCDSVFVPQSDLSGAQPR